MKRRGITFIEVLLVMGMSAILLIAIGGAYKAALDYSERSPERLADQQTETLRRATLQDLVSAAYLSTNINDTLTYFVGNTQSGDGTISDTLTFTTLAVAPDGGLVRSTETDFETLNETFGSQGGVTEVSLSTSPVGLDSQGEGLFIRTQTPSDGDITQGGRERLLIPDVQNLTFEFWDGLEWTSTWDTRANARRLPAAVRLNFQVGDNAQEQTMIIRVLNSDVTPQNPLTVGGTQ